MPQDVLNPKSEEELAKERDVKPLKHPGGVERPQTVPTMGAPEGASSPSPLGGAGGSQPSGEPAQPLVNPEQKVMQNLLYRTPEALAPNTVQLSGEDVAKNYDDPLDLVTQEQEDLVNQTDSPVRYERATRSQFVPQYQTDIDTKTNEIKTMLEESEERIRKQNEAVIQGNVFGLNGNNIGRDGVPKPALSADLGSRGISSELGKALEDKLNTVGKVGERSNSNWWAEVATGILGLGFGGSQMIKEALPDFIQRPLDRYEKAGRRLLGIKEKDFQDFVDRVTEYSSESAQPVGKFDPSKGKFGDYGQGGIGGALYVLNALPSLVTGTVYNVADNIRSLYAEDPYKGNRLIDAYTKGRDWSFSNQWTPEKYISLQEPEEIRGKNIKTGNLYWDLPDIIADKVPFIDRRLAHWALQGVPAALSEVILDVPSDYLWDAGVKVARGTKLASDTAQQAITSAAEAAAKKTDDVIIRSGMVPRGEPKVSISNNGIRLNTGTTEFNFTGTVQRRAAFNSMVSSPPPVVNLVPNVWKPDAIIDYKKIINSKYKPGKIVADISSMSDLIDVFPSSALTTTRRSVVDLTNIGKSIPDPWSNRSLVPLNSMPLSSNELKALENADPFNMATHGMPVLPPSPDAVYMLPGDQGIIKFLPPATDYEATDVPLLGVTSKTKLQDLLNNQRAVSVRLMEDLRKGKDSSIVLSGYDDLRRTTAMVAVKKAKLLDDGLLYETFKRELPKSLRSADPDISMKGEIMLQSDFNLTNLGIQRNMKQAELHDLGEKIRTIDVQAQVIGDIGRQDIDLSLRTKEWSDGYVPELDLDATPPLLDDEPDLSGWGSTTYGLDDEFDDVGDPMIEELGDGVPPIQKEVAPFPDDFVPEDGFTPDEKVTPTESKPAVGNKLLTLDEVTALPEAEKNAYLEWMDSLTEEEFGAILKAQKMNEGLNPATQQVEVEEVLSDYSVGEEKAASKEVKGQGYNLDDVARAIDELDKETQSGNYLPIYHLRERFPDRKALDKALYKLNEDDVIELSTLAEVKAYTPEQVSAGIPQPVGGNLFFIIKSNEGIDLGLPGYQGKYGQTINPIEKKARKKLLNRLDLTNNFPELTNNYIEALQKFRRFRTIDEWKEYLRSKGFKERKVEIYTNDIVNTYKIAGLADVTDNGDIIINQPITDPVIKLPEDDNYIREADAFRYYGNYEPEPTDSFNDFKRVALSKDDVRESAIKRHDAFLKEGEEALSKTKTGTVVELIEKYINNTPLKKLPETEVYFTTQNLENALGFHPALAVDIITATYSKLQRIFNNNLPKILIDFVNETAETSGARLEWWERNNLPTVRFNNVYDDMGANWEGLTRLSVNLAHELGHAIEFILDLPEMSEYFILNRSNFKVHPIDSNVAFDNAGVAQRISNNPVKYDLDFPGREYMGQAYRSNNEVLFTELVSCLMETVIDPTVLSKAPKEYQQFIAAVIERVRKIDEPPKVNLKSSVVDGTFIPTSKAYEFIREKGLLPAVPADYLPIGRSRVEQIQNATPDGHKGKITVAPKYFIKSESVTGNLYHGTTLSKSVLLKNLDVVQGGSPSEFGIGIYITNDRTAATYAATKNDTINKPPTLGVPKGEPHLRRIFMPSKSKILNLNEKPNKGLRNIFSEAAYLATKDERFSSTFHEGITEIGKMWNAFREGYFKLYGTPASESVVREFQQYITKSFQGQGIKIGVYKGANDITTYIAYDPKGIVDKTSALDNIQPVGYSERVVSQNKLDEITLKQLGDKVSIANYLQSSREVADTIMTQTARELAEIEASMIDELTTATRMEYDIENATADEFVNNAQNLEDTLPQRVEKDYNIKWEKQSQSPCPPIPNKIPRGL